MNSTRRYGNKYNSTKKHNTGVVTIGLIYANWCGHCKALKPEWQKMKHNIMKTPIYKKGQYKFAEIEDADHNKNMKMENINSILVGEKLSANGFPTIFKIKHSKLDYYQGDRNAGELQKWFLGSHDNPMTKSQHMQRVRPTPSLFQRIFGGGKTRKNKKI